MKQKKSKRKGMIYYLNHKNLIAEIEQYGHALSFKELLVSYLKVVFAGIVAAYLFKLPLYGYIIIIGASMLFVSSLIISSYKSLYEQRKFSDANLYLEKMLYFFKKSQKIYLSLNEALKMFPSGNIHNLIQNTIVIIRTSEGENVKEEALKLIEEEFPNNRIKTLHSFMLNVESKGGDPSLGVDMLLEDRELWKNRVVSLQQDKQIIKKNVIIALILTLGLCLSILYLPFMIGNLGNMDISGNIFVQWSAIFLIVFLFFFYTKVNKQLCTCWLEYDIIQDESNIEKRYNDFINVDIQKEKLKSMIYAFITVIGTAIIFLSFNLKIILFFGFASSLFFLNSYKIGYKIEKKNITKEISKFFPTWLLNIALLMQYENVHMAIALSYEDAPAILKPAIKQLLEEIDDNPASPTPFNRFLSDFSLSEVKESMNTLYSISEASGGNIDDEFRQIITRVNKYMDKAEQIKNNDKLAIMSSYISAPAFIGSIKLAIDMVVMLMTFISMSNSIV